VRAAPEAGAPAEEAPAAEAPAAEAPTAGLGDLPRNETLIADILTGRVGSPSNFNELGGLEVARPRHAEPGQRAALVGRLRHRRDHPGLARATRPTTKISRRSRFRCVRASPGDGEPFTADDVVFTVETLMAHEGFNANSYFVENVKSVSAPDDNTRSPSN
jgi:peptide/nickel transport system substrate-binding protein